MDPDGRLTLELQDVREGASIVVSLVPVVGDYKDVQEFVTGVDLITGEHLSREERILTGVAVLIPIVSAVLIRKGIKAVGETTKMVPNPGGRLGSPETRAHIADVRGELKSRGFEITGGGGVQPEEYIRGPSGGRKGSAFPDITATKGGRTIRINTVDTLKDGVTPTARERRNANRIRSLQPSDHLLLIPKPRQQ